jgi:hypothetical protein
MKLSENGVRSSIGEGQAPDVLNITDPFDAPIA